MKECPLKRPTAGSRCGMNPRRPAVCGAVRILGDEDHLGDMDSRSPAQSRVSHRRPDGHQDRGITRDHEVAIGQARTDASTSWRDVERRDRCRADSENTRRASEPQIATDKIREVITAPAAR